MFIVEFANDTAASSRSFGPVDNGIGPAIQLAGGEIQPAQPADKSFHMGGIGFAFVPLRLMADGQKIAGKRNGPAPEVIKIARYQDILAAEIGLLVLRAVDSRAEGRAATGIIIDAVAETL
jgi:hypothetical protein